MKISKLLLLGMLIAALAVPAFASQITVIKEIAATDPATYHVGDTVHFECTVANPGTNPNTNTLSSIYDTLPDGSNLWLVEPGVDPPLVQAPGDSQTYFVNYVVVAADVQEINGDFKVVNLLDAIGTDSLGDNVKGHTEKTATIVSTPDTLVGISANPDVGVATYNTTLTITEQNTGDDPITDVSVELRDITGTPTLIDTLTAAPTSGDFIPYGVLDIGETWTWIYGPVAVTGHTVFEVLGYGTGPLDEDVSFRGGYEFELATTEVDAITPAIEIVKTGPAYSKSEGPWGDGDTIQYHADITNIGTETLVIVSIDDDVFGNIGILNDYVLGVGDTVGLSYGYMPLPTDPDPLVNVITVVASYDVEGVVGTVTDDDDHEVDLLHPDFTVEKICLTDPIPEGEDAEFQITITNIGDAVLIITTDEAAIPGSILLSIGGDIVQTVTIPLEEGETSVYNEITVTATLDPMYDLPNVIVRSDSAECTTQGDTFCSFTQGFYGNAGGKACGDMTTTAIINAAIADGADPILIGALALDSGDTEGPSIIFNSAACIINRLPAGGKAKALPSNLGNVNCDDNEGLAGLVKKKKPEIANVLVGQTVALSLNVRLADIPCLDPPDSDSPLGSYVFDGDPEVEEDVYICIEGEDGCIERYLVPEGLKGLSADDILWAANMVLAGEEGMDAGAINDAASFINELFDECRSIVTCPIDPTEICDDGCDNDFDGFVDCDDPDCEANEACTSG